jgi:UDP-N-acetylmuramate dehydrogenase
MIEKENVKENEKLELHTTFKVGGTCKYFITPKNIEELIDLVKYLKENNIKYMILGNGSNTIFSSKEYDGVIINLSNLNHMEIKDNLIYVESGYQLIKLSMDALNNSLSGLEFAAGIPGNVGGAIFMNAGAYKSDMSNLIKEVTFLDENLNLKTLEKEKLNFSYRKSLFQEHPEYIILSTVLELNEGIEDDIKALMDSRKERRISSQPLEYPSAGSVFRNPAEDIFAGKLIEDLGLKGYQIGGAKISEKHANFIINVGGATGEDIKALIDLIKSKVKEKYNIDLHVEQRFINFEE